MNNNSFRGNKNWSIAILVVITLLLVACNSGSPIPQPTATLIPTPIPSQTPTPTSIPLTSTATAASTPTQRSLPPMPTEEPVGESVRFAVIGDYGNGSQNEADVADLIRSWTPDLHFALFRKLWRGWPGKPLLSQPGQS